MGQGGAAGAIGHAWLSYDIAWRSRIQETGKGKFFTDIKKYTTFLITDYYK